MKNLLEKLNDRQKEAVLCTDGPVLIIAGAGSGKTMVLTHKIAYLVLEKGVPLHAILAVTFTNKAAAEMKERVARILEKHAGVLASSSQNPTIGTFHSICLGILKKHAHELGYKPNIVIFDDKDQESLMQSIFEEQRISKEQFTPDLFLNQISKLKNKLISPEDFASTAEGPFPAMIAAVYARYQQALVEHNAVDFDDMIGLVVRLFEKNEAILNHYQNAFHYILIDEYQDTNFAQYRLSILLAKKHRNICAVGDNDQAIYGWRQADITNILNFERDWPDAKVFVLEENYRSTQTILSAANHVIAKNKLRKEKNLFTRNESGAKIHLIATDNEQREAEFTIVTIRSLVRGGTYTLDDCAILYRTNAQSRAIEEALVRARVPYRMTGGFKFYERKEVKDIVCYLRFLHNDKDLISLERIISVPPRGIGKVAYKNFTKSDTTTKALDTFFALIASLRETQKTMPLSAFIKKLVHAIDFEAYLKKTGKEEGQERWENVLELISAASAHDTLEPSEALASFLDALALVAKDEVTGDGRAVRVMTIHAAKGLEFGVVFLLGMEDNIFPHSRSKNSREELEEERRLCYVALTRAKKQIYLLFAHARKLYGQLQANPPSRFLFDIPEHLIEARTYPSGREMLDRDELEHGIVDIDTA